MDSETKIRKGLFKLFSKVSLQWGFWLRMQTLNMTNWQNKEIIKNEKKY